MFGDRFRRVGRNSCDRDSKLFGGFEIDIVKTGAAQRDQPRPLFRKRCKHGAVDRVVDESTDRAGPGRKTYSLRGKAGLEIAKAMQRTAGRIGEVQKLPIISACAENRHVHCLLLLVGTSVYQRKRRIKLVPYCQTRESKRWSFDSVARGSPAS
jgi:hypothetical protein